MSRERRHPLASRLGKVAAAISATVATLAALVGVLEFADKQIDPEVPVLRARIAGVEIRDIAQPLRDYLEEVRPTDKRRSTGEELRVRGYTFLLGLSAEGPRGTHLRLRWALYTAGGRRIRDPDYSQVASDFTTAASAQEREWPVWVPPPPRRGRYVVRFTLEDDDGRLIDQAQSPPFAHRRDA